MFIISPKILRKVDYIPDGKLKEFIQTKFGRFDNTFLDVPCIGLYNLEPEVNGRYGNLYGVWYIHNGWSVEIYDNFMTMIMDGARVYIYKRGAL